MNGFLKRFAQNRGALIGLAILFIVILVAIIAPLIYPMSPWKMVQRPFLAPFDVAGLPLGTDTLGRNVASGLAHGARISLLIGLVSTVVALAIGVPLGAVAGYYGGIVDDALMRFTVVAIAVVSWPPVARLVRGEVLSLRTREYVEAATLAGQSNTTIILRQILPNTLSPIIVLASLMVATAILLESSLSFLGLGDPNVMSWGYMIGAARTVIRQAWWLSFFPGVAILLTVLALNLVGEGLNDALNPRLARQGH